METPFSLISRKTQLLALLLLIVATGATAQQAGGLALAHMEWFPAGSYVGFVHIDLTAIDPQSDPVVNEILDDIDLINLRGAGREWMQITVGMAQGLDKQRQRRLEQGRTKKKEGGMWFFFDEIVIVEVDNLDQIVTVGIEKGYLTAGKPIYKIPVYKQLEENREKATWVARIGPSSVLLSNEKNKLIAAIKSGTGRGESVLDDPHLQDIQTMIPASPLWFVAPEKASLYKDYDYAESKGESQERLDSLQKEIERRAEYLILSFDFNDGVSISAEAIFETEEIALQNLSRESNWVYDLIPFDKDSVIDEVEDNSGRYLKATLTFDTAKILNR